MNAKYWNTVNEGGEGYVKRAPATRSRDEVEFDLRDAERDLASAKINAAYKNNKDGSDYKVERLEAKILKLRAELGFNDVATPAPAVVVPITAQPAKKAAPAAGATYYHAGARYTREQLFARMARSEAAALIGGETFGADARANVAAIKKILGL